MPKKKTPLQAVMKFLDELEELAHKDTNEFEIAISRIAKFQMVVDLMIKDTAQEAFQQMINEYDDNPEDMKDIDSFFNKDDNSGDLN